MAEHTCIDPNCPVCRPMMEQPAEHPYGGVHTREEDEAWSKGDGKLATSPSVRIRLERAVLTAAGSYISHPDADTFQVLEAAVKNFKEIQD